MSIPRSAGFQGLRCFPRITIEPFFYRRLAESSCRIALQNCLVEIPFLQDGQAVKLVDPI